MAALDTNVLVRLLLEDDPRQVEVVKRLLEAASREQARFYAPVTVTLELEWVLRSRYSVSKPDLVLAFTNLLELIHLDFESEAAIEQALHLYKSSTADFADCLHTSLATTSAKGPLLTFDRKASRLPGAEAL